MKAFTKLNATGETITFTKTAADTNGELLEMVVTLPPRGEGPPPHRHPLQTERFEAIEGKPRLMCGGEEVLLEPGESFVVPKNGLHTFFAADETEIKFKATFSPALHIQYLLTEIFESCNRKDSKEPSVFDASYILHQMKGEYRLEGIPIVVQNCVFPIIAWIGKALGLVKAKSKSEYEKAGVQ